MSKDRKGPPGRNPFLEDDRDALLDDLDNIKSLLGDSKPGQAASARPGPHDDIPMLLPEDDATPSNPPEGDVHTQTSLFDQQKAPAPASAERDRQHRLAHRENPFLSRANTPEPAIDPPPVSQAQNPPAGKDQQHARHEPRQPSDAEVRTMVDEVLAAWLPRLERELRERLTEWFRKP